MKAPKPRRARAGLLGLAAAALLPLAAGAAPQPDHHKVRHREVVVVGGHGDHSMVLGGFAQRGFLGVQLVDLTPELRRYFGAEGDRGVLVSRVVEGSPAAEAGIEVGDLIVAIDGEPLRGSVQLVGRLGRRREGDTVELELSRRGSGLTVQATLVENQRRQVEIGQFLWQGEDGEKRIFGLDPESFDEDFTVEIIGIDLEDVDRVITVDPQSINESVRSLMERIEAGELPGPSQRDGVERERLEQRLEELEERLREMERQLESGAERQD